MFGLDVREKKEHLKYLESERGKGRSKELEDERETLTRNLELRITNEDIALYEIFQNPVHFAQFFFPHPESKVPLGRFSWNPNHALSIWQWQYPFYLWMVACFCCGKNIGKSFSIVMRRVWKAIWSPGKTSVIAAGKEQYSRRLWERILYWFNFHPIFNYWRPTDMTRKGQQSMRHMWFSLKSHWRCQALLSGIGGQGFMGERGYDRTIDEAGMLSEAEHAQIRNLLEEPFRPQEWMEDLNFGIPTGDRTSPFYQMDTDDSQYGRYSKFRRKIPAFLHPGITYNRFLEMLRENQVQFDLRGDRIVVIDWGGKATEIILGQWGDVERPCFPPDLYERNIFPVKRYNYQTWMITPKDVGVLGIPALATFLSRWGDRSKVPGLHRKEDSQSKVIVSVDPGKQNCAIMVWGRRKVVNESHYRWWLLGRVMLRGSIDAPTQARVVDSIATNWDADIIVSDTSSQSSYLADTLSDRAIFPKSNRYYLRDESTIDLSMIREAKSSGKQIVLGISASRMLAVGVDDMGEARLAGSDVAMVYGLIDMMGEIPHLALPPEAVDSEFYASMTSYSEKPKGTSGPRFSPGHSHWVSCAKILWAAYWLFDVLPIAEMDRETRRPAAIGRFVPYSAMIN